MEKTENKKNCFKAENNYLTDNHGRPITNDSDSLTVGENGPVLLEDLFLVEKLASFDRERIPERVVHAKGAGAFGHFKLINSMGKFTKAKIFNDFNTITPVAVRFSTVVGSKGSADTARDPRGFATKFYTVDGNLDIVGNHIPIFFIRDSKKFPDMIHAFKPSPENNIVDNNRFWDFISSNPESTNMITFLFSDLGTIKSYRTIGGFGVNTFIWINNEGERVFIKYHWVPVLGVKTISRVEAEMLSGTDPDIATKDLFNTIANGGKVEYILKVQIMPMHIVDSLDFDPLDDTKVWPEDKFPLLTVGKMTLDKNPDNFFGEIEQIAFCPANIVPGIELSSDKMLQGRGFAYRDTQRHRIGANFAQLPVNAPRVDVNNNSQDGPMSYKYNKGSVNYKPNTLNDNLPKVAPSGKEKPVFLEGNAEMKPIDKQNNFKQAGERFKAMSEKEKEILIDNIAASMMNVNYEIQMKATENFGKADPQWGNGVRRALRLHCR